MGLCSFLENLFLYLCSFYWFRYSDISGLKAVVPCFAKMLKRPINFLVLDKMHSWVLLIYVAWKENYWVLGLYF